MGRVETVKDHQAWDEVVLELQGHPLQLSGWGELKAAHNWRVERLLIRQDDQTIIGAVQLLIRRLPWPFKNLLYVPRGPVCAPEHRGEVLQALLAHAKANYRAVALTIEPGWTDMPEAGKWRQTDNTILIARTLVLDLDKSEDQLLADMTKKTRQYIRKSGREELVVRQVKTKPELQKCLQIYHQTAARAGFGLHQDQYYHDVFDKLGQHSVLMAAYVDDSPVAFIWLTISQNMAFELYGGMDMGGQQLRANYTLKWQTIQLMKKWGIERYDMNGLLNDGVSLFKQGFAKHENQLVGTYDYRLSIFYPLWIYGLPAAKKLLQKIKNR